MKLTLITACFNSAATIRDALESVKSQRLPPDVALEHIVVDGGSTDGTEKVVSEFARTADAASVKTGGAGSRYSVRWVSERDRGMYDAINKGIGMSTGEVIGIVNADDVLAADDTLAGIAAAFADPELDGTYADIRFVRDASGSSVGPDVLRNLPTVRYCAGRWFRPWMFRFGTQTAHPSTFFRKSCFSRWGGYSLDFGMYGDFELLCRFIWKHRARMRYLPVCTTVMRLGGASTNGWRTTLKINRSDLAALRANGCWSCLPLLYLKYPFKIWGFVFGRSQSPSGGV